MRQFPTWRPNLGPIKPAEAEQPSRRKKRTAKSSRSGKSESASLEKSRSRTDPLDEETPPWVSLESDQDQGGGQTEDLD